MNESSDNQNKNKLNSKNIIIGTIAVILAITFFLVVFINSVKETQAVSKIVAHSEKLLTAGHYEEANRELKEALKIKRTPELITTLDLTETLIQSDKDFKKGVKLFEAEDYDKALKLFNKVNVNDKKNYDKTQEYKNKVTKIKAQNLLDEAKRQYDEGVYISAFQKLQEAIKLDPSLEEAKELMPEYEEAKIKQEEENAYKIAKEKMKQYEFGSGVVGIAVTNVKGTSRVDGSSFYYYVEDPKNSQYLWLYINALNKGTRAVHVNPNDFTVTTPGGYTANYNKASFQTKYLEATNIPSGAYSAGWLIFLVPKADKYFLHYNGLGGSVTKQIVFRS